MLNIGRQSGGLCDSPLERGVGVCYVSSLTHPHSRTFRRAPSQEGSYGGIYQTNTWP